tara:strand:+ start:247 stop:408 length:162 start_codon:yes stop_codon:yes gene_type:complete
MLNTTGPDVATFEAGEVTVIGHTAMCGATTDKLVATTRPDMYNAMDEAIDTTA